MTTPHHQTHGFPFTLQSSGDLRFDAELIWQWPADNFSYQIFYSVGRSKPLPDAHELDANEILETISFLENLRFMSLHYFASKSSESTNASESRANAKLLKDKADYLCELCLNILTDAADHYGTPSEPLFEGYRWLNNGIKDDGKSPYLLTEKYSRAIDQLKRRLKGLSTQAAKSTACSGPLWSKTFDSWADLGRRLGYGGDRAKRKYKSQFPDVDDSPPGRSFRVQLDTSGLGREERKLLLP